MTTLAFDGSWTLTALSGEAPDDLLNAPISATVPGCAHLDLLAAGLIDDPFDGDNEAAQQWIGSTVWRYARSFTWAPDGEDRHDLVAEGLDTLATITLNGTVIAQTENQNRTYRWNISHLLRSGQNDISITFDAPVPAAERREREHGGPRFHVNHHPYNTLRKTASNFGWDWGIDVATSGIWRPLRIDGWSRTRIAAVRPLVDVIEGTGVLTAHVDIDHDGLPTAVDVTVTVSDEDHQWTSSSTVTTEGRIRVLVPDARLWWPRGHGAQDRYDVRIEIDGDMWEGTVGFRTIEVDTTPDAHGTPFDLRVNGRSVQVRGANWIPDDAFVTRIDEARLERRIRDAAEANMNLLRIWGGGMYESDAFYEICSREGILVWQDFLFACAAYAEEAWLADEIAAEAREAVTRLSRHAALAIWCGNNENLWGYVDWGWRASLEGRSWGEKYYLHLFPEILAELDPTRAYIPGSPFSASELMHPNDQHNGTVHIWDVWNTLDFTHYRQWRPRFVAEFGFQGPAAWRTLFDTVHDTPLRPDGPDLLVHQKANNGNQKLANGYAAHFPEPRTIEDWHYTTQLNQAHAVRYGISWFRSLAPYNTGTIVWQLNDDWPVISWSAVDYAERRKPLWFALRDVYAPRFATLQPSVDEAGGWELIVLNDTDEQLAVTAHGRRISFQGNLHATSDWDLTVPPRGVHRLSVPAEFLSPAEREGEIVVIEFPGAHGLARVVHDLAEVLDQRLDGEGLTATAEPDADGAMLTLRAVSYVRDVVIMADRADATAYAEDSVFSLLPGEERTIRIRADHALTADSLVDPTVIRHAGQLRPPTETTTGERTAR